MSQAQQANGNETSQSVQQNQNHNQNQLIQSVRHLMDELGGGSIANKSESEARKVKMIDDPDLFLQAGFLIGRLRMVIGSNVWEREINLSNLRPRFAEKVREYIEIHRTEKNQMNQVQYRNHNHLSQNVNLMMGDHAARLFVLCNRLGLPQQDLEYQINTLIRHKIGVMKTNGLHSVFPHVPSELQRHIWNRQVTNPQKISFTLPQIIHLLEVCKDANVSTNILNNILGRSDEDINQLSGRDLVKLLRVGHMRDLKSKIWPKLESRFLGMDFDLELSDSESQQGAILIEYIKGRDDPLFLRFYAYMRSKTWRHNEIILFISALRRMKILHTPELSDLRKDFANGLMGYIQKSNRFSAKNDLIRFPQSNRLITMIIIQVPIFLTSLTLIDGQEATNVLPTLLRTVLRSCLAQNASEFNVGDIVSFRSQSSGMEQYRVVCIGNTVDSESDQNSDTEQQIGLQLINNTVIESDTNKVASESSDSSANQSDLSESDADSSKNLIFEKPYNLYKLKTMSTQGQQYSTTVLNASDIKHMFLALCDRFKTSQSEFELKKLGVVELVGLFTRVTFDLCLPNCRNIDDARKLLQASSNILHESTNGRVKLEGLVINHVIKLSEEAKKTQTQIQKNLKLGSGSESAQGQQLKALDMELVHFGLTLLRGGRKSKEIRDNFFLNHIDTQNLDLNRTLKMLEPLTYDQYSNIPTRTLESIGKRVKNLDEGLQLEDLQKLRIPALVFDIARGMKMRKAQPIDILNCIEMVDINNSITTQKDIVTILSVLVNDNLTVNNQIYSENGSLQETAKNCLTFVKAMAKLEPLFSLYYQLEQQKIEKQFGTSEDLNLSGVTSNSDSLSDVSQDTSDNSVIIGPGPCSTWKKKVDLATKRLSRVTNEVLSFFRSEDRLSNYRFLSELMCHSKDYHSSDDVIDFCLSLALVSPAKLDIMGRVLQIFEDCYKDSLRDADASNTHNILVQAKVFYLILHYLAQDTVYVAIKRSKPAFFDLVHRQSMNNEIDSNFSTESNDPVKDNGNNLNHNTTILDTSRNSKSDSDHALLDTAISTTKHAFGFSDLNQEIMETYSVPLALSVRGRCFVFPSGKPARDVVFERIVNMAGWKVTWASTSRWRAAIRQIGSPI